MTIKLKHCNLIEAHKKQNNFSPKYYGSPKFNIFRETLLFIPNASEQE